MTEPDWTLASGGSLRITGDDGPLLLLLGGSSYQPGPGRWSAAMEWLAPQLVRAGYRSAELRYPGRSWREMPSAIEAAREALSRLEPVRGLVGFSMGGAVAAAVAPASSAGVVVGLAPWIPEQIELGGLRGRRLRVLHGSLDRPLPGVPGVSPDHSRAVVERARGLGIDATHELVPGAVHLVAYRIAGRLLPAPRAGAWRTRILTALAEDQAG